MRSEFLDIPVYDDNELTEILGKQFLQREKIHHWPLSYVERIDLEGKSVIAKYSKLSLENSFYSSVSHDFILKPVFMAEMEDTSVTILPFINGREPEQHEIYSAIERIQAISSDIYWADASSFDKFMDLIDASCTILEKYDAKEFCEPLRRKCSSLSEFFVPEKIGYVHGDLKRDNIIICGGNPIIIDWQRPMKAPLVIDRVTCGLEDAPDAVCLAKIFETYWLLYAFNEKLNKLPHVINWALKNLESILK